ncbi:MAG: hypothetical protein VKK04_13285, partial [Synechococcales bacterium]|nr:hypothetical protein [Synechococcales bacterium]
NYTLPPEAPAAEAAPPSEGLEPEVPAAVETSPELEAPSELEAPIVPEALPAPEASPAPEATSEVETAPESDAPPAPEAPVIKELEEAASRQPQETLNQSAPDLEVSDLEEPAKVAPTELDQPAVENQVPSSPPGSGLSGNPQSGLLPDAPAKPGALPEIVPDELLETAPPVDGTGEVKTEPEDELSAPPGVTQSATSGSETPVKDLVG